MKVESRSNGHRTVSSCQLTIRMRTLSAHLVKPNEETGKSAVRVPRLRRGQRNRRGQRIRACSNDRSWLSNSSPFARYPHAVIPSYPHTLIPSYPHTLIPSYPHTIPNGSCREGCHPADAAFCVDWLNWIDPLGCSNFSGALSSFLGMFAIVGIIHPTLTTIGVGSDSCCWLIADGALIRQRVKDHGCQTLAWFDDSRMNPGPRDPHV